MPSNFLKKIRPDKQQTKSEKQKLRRRYNIQFQSLLIINIVVFLALALYSYKNYLDYSFSTEVFSRNNQLISSLTLGLSESRSTLKEERENLDQKLTEVSKDLAIIFPEAESYTELTRQLDQFFFSVNSINPPIIHNNLRFEPPIQSADNAYFILPFSMSIQSSRENFDRFLDYVEKSGSIGTNVRLMSIESIQINFIKPSPENIDEFDINFTVNMNAYFQNNSNPA